MFEAAVLDLIVMTLINLLLFGIFKVPPNVCCTISSHGMYVLMRVLIIDKSGYCDPQNNNDSLDSFLCMITIQNSSFVLVFMCLWFLLSKKLALNNVESEMLLHDKKCLKRHKSVWLKHKNLRHKNQKKH